MKTNDAQGLVGKASDDMFEIKYKPKISDDIIGQQHVVKILMNFLKHWKKGDRPILLYGPTGTGKTSLAKICSQESAYSIIMISGESIKNATELHVMLNECVKLTSLCNKKRVIVVESVDEIKNKGIVTKLIEIIKQSSYPFILIASNLYEPNIRELRNISVPVEVKPVSTALIEKLLKKICVLERLLIDELTIKQIARSSAGDVRAALIDLHSAAMGAYEIGYRERIRSPFEILRIIFRSRSLRSAIDAAESSDIDPEHLMLWLAKNVTTEFSDNKDIACAMELLSKSDVFRARLVKRQQFVFKRYMLEIFSGIGPTRKRDANGFVLYEPPKKLLKAENEEKLIELAQALHCSKEKVRTEYLPFLNHFCSS